MDSSHSWDVANCDLSDWNACSSRLNPTFHLSIGIVPFEDIFLQVRKPTKNPDFRFSDFPLPIIEWIKPPLFLHTVKRDMSRIHRTALTSVEGSCCTVILLPRELRLFSFEQLHSTKRFPLYIKCQVCNKCFRFKTYSGDILSNLCKLKRTNGLGYLGFEN